MSKDDKEHKLDLKVIVSGKEVIVSTNTNATLRSVAEKALHDTGNVGQDLSRWEMTTPPGVVLNFDAKVGDAGLKNGDTVLLNPRAGVTG